MLGKKRVLVLAPHTDDGEFGCGGTISKFIKEGKEVFYVAFSTAEKSVPKGMPRNILETEVREATRILGIKEENLIVYKHEVRKLNYVRQEILEELVRIKNDIEPDIVFSPSLNDLHQDHSTVAMESLRAFKQISIIGYELPWNNISFNTSMFVKLDKKYVENKIAALKAYKSQQGKIYATEDFILSWAKTRGTQIGAEYAETYEVIRWIVG
jgi:LmbE family N-acetylglucosaminyl deacetylase